MNIKNYLKPTCAILCIIFLSGCGFYEDYSHVTSAIPTTDFSQYLGLEKNSVRAVFEPVYVDDIVTDLGISRMFRFKTEKFPCNQFYHLIEKNLHDKIDYKGRLIANNQGELFFDNQRPLADLLVIGKYNLPGEAGEYFIVSDDKTIVLRTYVVSNPLEVENKHGNKISLRLMDSDAEFFSCRIEGFGSNEVLKLSSDSGGELVESIITTGEDGTLQMTLAPAVGRQSGGEATIILTRLNGDFISLDYPWGEKLFEEMRDKIEKINRK